jgi:hypothetical protein
MIIADIEDKKIEKCTKQFALSVKKNVKFLLNLQKAEMFFVKIVIEAKEDINLILF